VVISNFLTFLSDFWGRYSICITISGPGYDKWTEDNFKEQSRVANLTAKKIFHWSCQLLPIGAEEQIWGRCNIIGINETFHFNSYFIFLLRTWGVQIIQNRCGEAQWHIDYRCEDGRFPVSASCVTISNPDSLSSSGKGVNPGMRSWKKKTLIWMRLMS
jgi:hypothetical protein